MSLPIEQIKAQFCNYLARGNVIVAAATGSGKSTQLPVWAAQQGRVLVIQPRRIACTSLAEYVAQQQGSPLGEQVGYAIRFEGQFRESTEIVFATPGVALRWYFENRLINFAVVMLDEFHERRWDMDLLLAMLKQQAAHRLIVTSATLSADRLASYLGAPLLTSEGKMFDVEERFLAKDMRAMPSRDILSERVKAACEYALQRTQGDILVFLPGKGEIMQCAAQVKALGALVIPLFSGCAPIDQQRALQQQAQQRIILATNVAETSLTIPNITCVIDSGLERRTHLRNGKTVLGLDAIGRDSAKQRLGRAGRTQEGLCLRLYGQYAPLIERTPPEVQREALTELVLAAGCATDGIDALSFIDPLPASSAQKALDLLRKIGALDAHNRATELGKQLYPLPVDVELGHLITHMPDNRLRQAMIDAVAVMSVPARVYQLPSDAEQIEQLCKALPNNCDLELVIALIRGKAPSLRIEEEALREARQFSAQLREAFSLPPLDKAASYDRDALLTAIASARPDWLYIKRQNRRGAFGNGVSEVVPAKESRIVDNCEAMIVMDTYALAGKGIKQATTLATLSAPVPVSLLAQYARTETILERAYLLEDKVWVEQVKTYAGTSVQKQTQRADGAMLIPACVSLIEQDLLFQGVYKQVSTMLAYEALYHQQQQAETPQQPKATEWIAQTLTDLGVETPGDLTLIDVEDLSYHPIEDWIINPFIEKYPLQVELPELAMLVTYSFSAKRILLEYISGNRKDAPKRWELPAWPGFKIRYKKASKVVEIR
ncbi:MULTISPECIES: helicase-related protein [unclassified Pseudoalteromonas]|uniref:DEAD/DEAH box helicase n=1 Tax=unclassified Pseudoalteromonas TaxID=194690 RepID=UPI002098604C|nr:helicase-related protein [Pseudoalteromonas sp. XMcav2-N]MCO7186952.1 DEAD/DEAH box helicase [Pseudoalteromonas sp. XMcav2-N]